MASVYRKSTGVYYLAVTFQNSRVTRSLGTRCYETAKRVTPQIEKQILSDITVSYTHLTLPTKA